MGSQDCIQDFSQKIAVFSVPGGDISNVKTLPSSKSDVDGQTHTQTDTITLSHMRAEG